MNICGHSFCSLQTENILYIAWKHLTQLNTASEIGRKEKERKRERPAPDRQHK